MIVFSTQILKIKNSLSGFFDGVYDSFESLNISEHLNETLCFVGVSDYTLKETVADHSGRGYAPSYVTFTVTALSKRNMSADEITRIVDNHAVPAVNLTDLNIRSLKRNECHYSKEHGRYSISFDFDVYCELAAAYTPVTRVRIGEVSFDFFTDWEFSNGYKTYKLGTLFGELVSGVSRKEPMSLKLQGEVIASSGQIAYANIAQYTGATMTVAVDDSIYTNMFLQEARYQKKGEKAYITVSFCEVNE